MAIQLTARLLTRLIGEGPWPLELCEAVERAHLAPMTFGSVRGFGAALQCIPADRGATLLAAYVRNVAGSSAHSHPDRATVGAARRPTLAWLNRTN